MTLPAFAAERVRRVPTADRCLLQVPSLSSKTSRTPLLLSIDGTDGHPTVIIIIIIIINRFV